VTEEVELPRLDEEGEMTVVSFHYDVRMRLRRITLYDGRDTLQVTPVIFGEDDAGLQVEKVGL